jgi:hypothetical protein
MELRCELSPLVFAELYKILAAESDLADVLEERLRRVELDHEWLLEAAEGYERKWQWFLSYAASLDDHESLPADHALLASWVLAGLRSTGSSYELGAQLRTAVTERAFGELDPSPADLPSQWRPVILGWTLGMAVGKEREAGKPPTYIDHELPVAPAYLPLDVNVRAAYWGLVEHVLELAITDPPWPEMLGTATFWRGTGLAEGLRPEAGGGTDAIRYLILEVKHSVPDYFGRQIATHFSPFAERRNTLSHVADVVGKPRFVDVKELARDWSQIRLTISGVTHFLCIEAASQLSDSAANTVRSGTWDSLKNDIEVW